MVTPALGVELQEERGADRSIARLHTARTAFVGRTLRGPLNRPVPVASFIEFQHAFGGLWQPSRLSYAVEHFFENGGVEALIVRVVNGARAATLTLRAGKGFLTLQAASPGTREFLRTSVDYDNIPSHDELRFNLTVQRVRVQGGSHIEDQEIFPQLSVLPGHDRYVGDVLLQQGDLAGAVAAFDAASEASDSPRSRGKNWARSAGLAVSCRSVPATGTTRQ